MRGEKKRIEDSFEYHVYLFIRALLKWQQNIDNFMVYSNFSMLAEDKILQRLWIEIAASRLCYILNAIGLVGSSGKKEGRQA